MLTVPDVNEYRVLRNVTIGDTGVRVLTWETGKMFPTGQSKIGYALYRNPRCRKPLFAGEDIGVSPMHTIDGDMSLAGVLSFLTVKPNTTDADYFEGYTKAQLDWCGGDVAEEIKMLVSDFEESNGKGESPFKNVEA